MNISVSYYYGIFPTCTLANQLVYDISTITNQWQWFFNITCNMSNYFKNLPVYTPQKMISLTSLAYLYISWIVIS